MSKLANWLAMAALVAACGGGDDEKKTQEPPKAPPAVPKAPPSAPTPPPEAPSDAPQAVPLTELGLQIDAPGTWTVKQLKADHYTFRIPFPTGTRIPPRLDIARIKAADKPPKTVDAAAKDCPAKVIEKKALDGGRFYYVCEQTAAGRTLRNFRLILPEASGDAISCSGNAGDVSALLAACETLRAQ